MFNSLGFSVYVSSFEAQKPMLERAAGRDAMVFLSLHISEEFGDTYCQKAQEICGWLCAHQFRIIADVSVKTLEQFGETDLVAFAKRFGIWALRIDYGFSETEICGFATQMPVVLNASTTTRATAQRVASAGSLVMAMHNFYPRPETGLDDDFLLETTKMLQSAGLKVLAFIPGDAMQRAPVFAGLPSLEAHRGQMPSACFIALKQQFGMDGVFVGDPGISNAEQMHIERYCGEGVICVPASLNEAYQSLYGKVFTNRVDAPRALVRFAESRVYSCFGKEVVPSNTVLRARGSITVDNSRYGRYSGEVQLVRKDFIADERVNVIGVVPPQAFLLMDGVRNGAKFILVPLA